MSCRFGGCSGGILLWAMEKLKDGIPDEMCFNYSGEDESCDNPRKCNDWQNRLVKIKDFHTLMFVSDVQEKLIKYGPISVGMYMSGDFYPNYSLGWVYSCPINWPINGHSVVIVGYDEINQQWIIKNSWGKGLYPYFRVGYYDCGIGIIGFYQIDIDLDNDSVLDNVDNCIGVYNPDQKDSNNDRIGDACCTPATCSSLGAKCGIIPNGCGNNLYCGTCPSNKICINNQCTCQSSCSGKQCGDDGCGGSCGTCDSGFNCNSNGQCIYSGCSSSCSGKQCGSDSCSGYCGSNNGGCPAGQVCDSNGKCINNFAEKTRKEKI